MSREGAEEEPAALSPNSRLKFLCSYGGKILPRPSDGQLKYVGGGTRILATPRAITFKELKERISGMFNNNEIVIKYKVFPEDLDSLVSVRSDEDLCHMREEYDRHVSLPRSPSSSHLFRIFIFRSGIATSPSTSPTYIDAINGGFISSIKSSLSIPIPSKPPMFAISSSSVCSSPDSSPLSRPGLLSAAAKSSRPGMARVHSTPNLSSLSLIANGGAGSPPRGGGGGGGGGGFFNPCHHHPHPHHPHPQHPMQQHKGVMMGYGGGGGMSRMGFGQQRHDVCGGGCVFSGHQNQSRYNCPPSPSGGPVWGPVDDPQTARSSHSSFNFSGAGTPPVVPRKSIWD